MRSTSRLRSSNSGWTRAGFLVGLGALLLVIIAVRWSHQTSRGLPGITHRVLIEGMKFSPAKIAIHAGDQVIFKNNDLVPHTVTSKEPGQFDSGTLKAGESWSFSPQIAGSFPFRCSFHPMMEGEIIVANPK